MLLVIVGAGFGYQYFQRTAGPVISNEPIVLTYWSVYEPKENIQPIIDEFQQQHPGITINYVRRNLQNYRQQIESTSGTSVGPDIFRYHSSWIRTVRKVSDVAPPVVTSAVNYQEDFYPAISQDLQTGTGSFYGIPLMYDGLGLYYNRQLFREAGIVTVPKEWTDIFGDQGVGSKLLQPGADLSVIAMGDTKNVDHWQDLFSLLLFQAGANPAQPQLTREETESALRFFKEGITKKYWNANNARSTELFAQGRLAMMFGTSWSAFEVQALNPQLDFAVAPVPQLPGTKFGYASYWIEGVSNRIEARKRDASWKFLMFLHNDEIAKRRFGIQSATRLFGEPYAQAGLGSSLSQNKYLSGILDTAPQAQSWYMADKTFSGGFNDEITAAYAGYVAGTETIQTLEAKVQTALRNSQ